MSTATLLSQKLAQFLDRSYVLHTRTHELNAYIKSSRGKIFIKREDELSAGIAGSKYRKYASLLPFLKFNNFDEVVLIGSVNSNNVLGAMQLLRENRIPATLFMLESNQAKPVGNELFLKMLLKDEKINYLSRTAWKNVNTLADEYRISEQEKGKKIFIIREGAAIPEAMPGTMTLALDILKNEVENGITFDHIFIDSGTGASAIGMILGFEICNVLDKQIHITLIAGTAMEFLEKAESNFRSLKDFGSFPHPDFGSFQLQLHFHKPITSASFGSMNKTTLKSTITIAKEEGILMEPVYSVKHLMTAKYVIESEKISGNCLFIYNGGALGLAGYMDKLSAI